MVVAVVDMVDKVGKEDIVVAVVVVDKADMEGIAVVAHSLRRNLHHIRHRRLVAVDRSLVVDSRYCRCQVMARAVEH